MSATTHVPVVVVGAGPVGSAAAILLAQRGVECVVLERWTSAYARPRAVHLDDELHRVLAQLGLPTAFDEISRPGRGLCLVDARGRVLGKVSRDGLSPATGYPRANMFDQPELERVLRQRLVDLPGVDLRLGVEVTGVHQTAPGVVEVTCRDGGQGAPYRLTADVVLGCDGANSVVREAMGVTMRDLRFEQRWLVVDISTTVELGHWEGVHQVCDSVRAATYMRIGETRHRWEFQLLDGETAADYATLGDLATLLAPWTSGVDVTDLELIRSAEYTFRAAVAERWREGRVFLLGDAAHLTPPFIGQGLGAGLRDAANLAWKVHGVLSGHLEEDVLDSYQQERAPHATAAIGLARTLGVVMTSGGRTGDRVRRHLVPAVMRLPPVRRQLAESASPPLRGSAWVTRGRRLPKGPGGRLGGHLCPNVEVGAADGLVGTRFDDRVGAGWVLVALAAPAPSDVGVLRERGCQALVVDPESALGHWLTGGSARAALVRPDRTVLASHTDPGVLVGLVSALLAPVGVTAAVG